MPRPSKFGEVTEVFRLPPSVGEAVTEILTSKEMTSEQLTEYLENWEINAGSNDDSYAPGNDRGVFNFLEDAGIDSSILEQVLDMADNKGHSFAQMIEHIISQWLLIQEDDRKSGELYDIETESVTRADFNLLANRLQSSITQSIFSQFETLKMTLIEEKMTERRTMTVEGRR